MISKLLYITEVFSVLTNSVYHVIIRDIIIFISSNTVSYGEGKWL